jgi:hypothetical protein
LGKLSTETGYEKYVMIQLDLEKFGVPIFGPRSNTTLSHRKVEDTFAKILLETIKTSNSHPRLFRPLEKLVQIAADSRYQRSHNGSCLSRRFLAYTPARTIPHRKI